MEKVKDLAADFTTEIEWAGIPSGKLQPEDARFVYGAVTDLWAKVLINLKELRAVKTAPEDIPGLITVVDQQWKSLCNRLNTYSKNAWSIDVLAMDAFRKSSVGREDTSPASRELMTLAEVL